MDRLFKVTSDFLQSPGAVSVQRCDVCGVFSKAWYQHVETGVVREGRFVRQPRQRYRDVDPFELHHDYEKLSPMFCHGFEGTVYRTPFRESQETQQSDGSEEKYPFRIDVSVKNIIKSRIKVSRYSCAGVGWTA